MHTMEIGNGIRKYFFKKKMPNLLQPDVAKAFINSHIDVIKNNRIDAKYRQIAFRSDLVHLLEILENSTSVVILPNRFRMSPANRHFLFC